jgi:hypothetical protein
MIQQPVAIGLTLCEQVIIEEGTRNVTLVNCCRRWRVREFPSTPQRLAIYAVLKGGQGTGVCKASISRLDTLEEIYLKEIPLTFADPLQEFGVLFRPPELLFPVAGRYEAILMVDGEPLAQRVFQVS